jgi:hypothetical protein
MTAAGDDAISCDTTTTLYGGGQQQSTTTTTRRLSTIPGDDVSAGCPTDDILAMQQLGELIDEFYYGVRIFPGQDPANVWVGWVTPQFHSYGKAFNKDTSVRRCRFSELDQHGYIGET